jgi:6-phosphogluconolactonase
VKPDVRVSSDADEMSVRAAEATVGTIKDAVRASGRCSLVLSGGSTPRTLYSLLASQFQEQVPWEHVHVFWGG